MSTKGVLQGSNLIESFLATLQTASVPEERHALQQSIVSWLPSYRWLCHLSCGHHPFPRLERHALFVLYAQATLDGIAETFRCFFRLPWHRCEVSHARLIAIFPALCTALQLTGKTEDVYAHICALHIRLQIVHMGQRSGEYAYPSPDRLHDCVLAIEQYLSALGTLCEGNRASRPLPFPPQGTG